MSSILRSRRFLLAAAAVLVLIGLGVAAYLLWFAPKLPGPDTTVYRKYVDHFEVGLAALDTEQARDIGGDSMSTAVALIPEEPAGWADRGLMYLRDHDLEHAVPDLTRRAHAGCRRAARSRPLLGWLDDERGNYADAVGHFQEGRVQAHPHDLHYP